MATLYTENVNMNVSGGYFSAKNQPDTNGSSRDQRRSENATSTMTGGETVGVCPGVRTMIPEKPRWDIQGGTVSTYLCRLLPQRQRKIPTWWFNQIGHVNSRHGAALDTLRLAQKSSYNDIFAGFQFYPMSLQSLRRPMWPKSQSSRHRQQGMPTRPCASIFAKPEERLCPV